MLDRLGRDVGERSGVVGCTGIVACLACDIAVVGESPIVRRCCNVAPPDHARVAGLPDDGQGPVQRWNLLPHDPVCVAAKANETAKSADVTVIA
jgi:hypothetical protein